MHIHSFHFRYLYSAPSRFLLRGAPDYSADTESEFHAEAHEQLRVKDLPRVPIYAAAWGGFEPATLRLQGTEHTPTPPRPIYYYSLGIAQDTTVSVYICRTFDIFRIVMI